MTVYGLSLEKVSYIDLWRIPIEHINRTISLLTNGMSERYECYSSNLSDMTETRKKRNVLKFALRARTPTYDRRIHSFRVKLVPIDTVKEWMHLDCIDTTFIEHGRLETSQSTLHISLQESAKNAMTCSCQIGRKLDSTVQNHFEQILTR